MVDTIQRQLSVHCGRIGYSFLSGYHCPQTGWNKPRGDLGLWVNIGSNGCLKVQPQSSVGSELRWVPRSAEYGWRIEHR